jgi:hypothetical protein
LEPGVIGVRLQGGPFDGDRAEAGWVINTPPTIYVVAHDGITKPVQGSEVYGRDEEDERGWLVYVWTDQRLAGGRKREERELVPAGASDWTPIPDWDGETEPF